VPKEEEVTEEWRKLHNEEVHNFLNSKASSVKNSIE
jgi:hypothetical protein